jgi:hypothetical protein
MEKLLLVMLIPCMALDEFTGFFFPFCKGSS